MHVFRTFVTGAHGPHLWMRRRRRRRLGLPGLQLPEVGVGRAAQGADAQARRRGAGRASTSRWAAPTRRSAGAGSAQMRARPRTRAGTAPIQGEVDEVEPGPTAPCWCSSMTGDAGPREIQVATTSSTAPGWRPTSPSTGCSPTCSTTAARAATRCGRLDVERHFEVRGTAQRRRARCTPRARPRSAATSPASTPSSACRSPPRRSPTTWPGAGFCQPLGPVRSINQWVRSGSAAERSDGGVPWSPR